MDRVNQAIRAHRFLLLLVALLALAVSQPLANRFIGGTFVYDGLMSTVVLAAVMIVFRRHRERLFALALAVPSAATRWVPYFLPHSDVTTATIVHHVLLVLFWSFAIFTILRGIFEETEILPDHLVGTVCGYILAGLAWGNAYTAIELQAADSFRIAPQILAKIGDEHYRALYFNYFSLCTLTNAGFGDITPTAAFATTLTWLEAAFGQFYIAVVVAQLVGLRLAQALSRSTRDHL